MALFKRKAKTYDDDDGRVIADMNVEGMPWYNEAAKRGEPAPGSQLTRHETWLIIKGSLKACAVVSLIFAAILVIYTLICTEVWFK